VGQAFTLASVATGYYAIKNTNSLKCLDVSGRSTAEGAAIIQYTCSSASTNQHWAITDVTTGEVRLTARHSGKVAEVSLGATADGSAIVQRTWSGANHQKFQITSDTGGSAGSGGSTAGASGTGGSTAGAGGAGSTAGSGGSSNGGTTGTGSSGGAGTGGSTSTGGSTGVTLPSRATVLATMRKANDWFMAKHPDPGADIITDKTRPSNLWTRATYYEGLMGLYGVETDASRKTSYLSYTVRWGNSHSWALTYQQPGVTTSNADNQACGQTYIDVYRIDPQATYIRDIKASIDAMIATPPTGTSAWWWIDAIQMSMPSFAKLGVLTNDTKYFDGMWTMYNNSRTVQGGGLWNPSEGLWYRDLHYTPSGGTATRMTAAIHKSIPGNTVDAYYLSPNGKSLYWSRGNGWVFAALVRVLDVLPSSDGHRATYVSDFQAMARALIAVQRSDGFWNESLFDPSHCASIGLAGQDGPETSGTVFFSYGLAWGIRKGLLDPAVYGPALQKAWNGLGTIALQSDGLLGYTQSTGDRPCTDSAALAATKLANFDDYGVGGFLLAGSEVYQLATN
jgi:rhamnogalacturonyl hydrolase YesR